MNLGEQIYKLRSQKGMSQGDLADALEVSRQSVSKWETNTSVPELDKLVKMSALFGATLDELVTGKAPEIQSVSQRPEWGGRVGIMMFGCAGLCLIITMLFANPFGIHIHEGVSLAVLLAPIGVAAMFHRNRQVFTICLRVMVTLSVAAGLSAALLHHGSVLLFCLTDWVVLLGWMMYLKKNG